MSSQQRDVISNSDRLLQIGRDRELAYFDAILQRRRPVSILVTGDAGVGKSRLLRALRLRALEQGWRASGGNHKVILSVRPTTTETEFQYQALSLLSAPAGTSFAEPTLRKFRLRPLNPLVEQLSQSASVVLIDGYRPNPNFAEWFVKRFVRDVKRTWRSPVVVIVADRPDAVAPLRPFADEFVSLEPLGPESLQLLFATIGRQIEPQMNSEELSCYVEAVENDPGILDSLMRALTLSQDLSSPEVTNGQ